MYLNFGSEHPISLQKLSIIFTISQAQEYILNHSIYWRHKYICIFSSFGGNIPMILFWEPEKKKTNKQGINCCPEHKPI